MHAEVAKLVDALVLGTSRAICGGSSPLLGTKATKELKKNISFEMFFLFVPGAGIEPAPTM